MGNEVGEAVFYEASRTADSSFIKPDLFESKNLIPVTTLQHKIEQLGVRNVDFLKLEAEEFEPEVLEGAGDSLRQFKKKLQ